MKNNILPLVFMAGMLALVSCVTETAEKEKKTDSLNPADNLPSHITRLTHFGQRADWSHDGSKILFLEKTFGDVYEVEFKTGIVRPVTHHYYHEGYVRALYLPNGDILLSGARTFNAEDPLPSRHSEAELWVMDKSLKSPPVLLNEKCSEGPAVSRKNMRIAWRIDYGDYPERLEEGTVQIWMGDVEYQEGVPQLINRKLILDNRDLPFATEPEPQNFRPPDEMELIFSSYGYQGCDVMAVNLESGEVINYSNAPDQYDEPEGIYPDGRFTLVECDHHRPEGVLTGMRNIDIFKLALDGSGKLERLTFFNDYPGGKASNPVISDDGRYMAFQMARTEDMAGVGYGIFIYDLNKVAE
jgi:Tol biopolymer transport system component